MERLTSNKDKSEMSMVELAHNSCYAKDGAAWYRDYDKDIDARALTRKLLKDFAGGDDAFTCDEDFDEYMATCLEDGEDSTEGLIALFYRNLWAMADLHAHLKHLEDLQEQGRLLELPCAVGDTVYAVKSRYTECSAYRKEFDKFNCIGCEAECDSKKKFFIREIKPSIIWIVSYGALIGKEFFLTRKEAEEALERMEDRNETD